MVDKKAMQKLFDKEGKAFISSDGVWQVVLNFGWHRSQSRELSHA